MTPRRTVRARARRTMLPLAVAAMSGCGGVGTLPKAITLHDFGPPAEASYAPAVPLRLLEVRAPSWLGSSGMQYRFADRSDQRRLTYTENRWVAAPSELIQTAMRRAFDLALPDGGGVRGFGSFGLARLAEDATQRGRRFAALRRMRLVDDHRVAPAR